jgi:hypothetical protein
MSGSILSTGIQGLQSGVNNARKAAEELTQAATIAADSSVGSENILQAIVALKVAENQVEASGAVVRAADEVLGSLLDTKA